MASNDMKRSLNGYYHDIKKALVCGGRERRGIIGSIKAAVACYLDEHPDADMDEIYANFGSAGAIAEEYCNNESADAISSKIKRSRIIVLSVVIALIVALLIYIAAIVTALISDLEAINGYSIIYITETSQSDTVDQAE